VTPEGQTTDAAPSALLPTLMHASASFANTNTSPPAASAPTDASPEAPAPPVAGLQARVASGDLSNLSTLDGIDPDHMGHGCVPEPASMILMTSGVLGLIVARRRKRQDGL